jgi:hypothetical protein
VKTLVIPDIHEQIKKLLLLEPLLDQAERVVFLGDWFDSFYQDRAVETAWWLKKHLDDKRFTFLLGNHDCQYAFNHPLFTCSGFNPGKKAKIADILTEDDWRQFKVYTQADGFLLSHAGFCPTTIRMATSAVQEDALDKAFRGKLTDVFAPGIARGGWEQKGGPTWLDWRREFSPVPGVKQIVGHSHGKEIRGHSGSYCIDTGLKHIAWIEGDEVTIEQFVAGEEKAA